MRNEYDISGLFYVVEGRKYRKYLDIRHKNTTIEKPDIMVVMMNPGSSYPIDGNEANPLPTPTVPDDTQDQIIKVMNNNSFEYARVLNLSDLRTPKSKKLYEFLKTEKENETHSIFSDARKSDFESLFMKSVPVIYAWGVNSALSKLAKRAIEKINNPDHVGIRKEEAKYAYYHPLPRSKSKRIEWVEKINAAIKNITVAKLSGVGPVKVLDLQ